MGAVYSRILARTEKAGWALGQNTRGGAIMLMRQPGQVLAGLVHARVGDDGCRVGVGDAGGVQHFARQVEPADAGVLVEVAQDVGQLQGAAQVVGQLQPRRRRHAEHPHRQTAHRARHPVAIEVELAQVRRADVLVDVHLHAVDHGQEVGLVQAEPVSRLGDHGGASGIATGEQGFDIRPPGQQSGGALLGGALDVVGDVVHGAAEGVDGEHRVALGLGQHPHAGIERTARGLGLDGRRVGRGGHRASSAAIIAGGRAAPLPRPSTRSAPATRASPSTSQGLWCTRSLSGS